MKTSRAAWGLAAVIAVGMGLFTYSRVHLGHSQAAAPHSVVLHWSPDAVATSYNVFRGTVSGGPYVKVGTTSTPSYVDTSVPSGGDLYYVVTSIGNHIESGFSKEIKVTVP